MDKRSAVLGKPSEEGLEPGLGLGGVQSKEARGQDWDMLLASIAMGFFDDSHSLNSRNMASACDSDGEGAARSPGVDAEAREELAGDSTCAPGPVLVPGCGDGISGLLVGPCLAIPSRPEVLTGTGPAEGAGMRAPANRPRDAIP